MRLSKIEIDILNKILKKTEEEKNRISQRRKSQLKGSTINKRIQKRQKPVRQGRKVTKKRSSIP